MPPTESIYEHILVPTDGSEGAEVALRGALTLAEYLGATVDVITVTAPPDVPSGYDTEFQEALRLEAERIVSEAETIAKEFEPEITTTAYFSNDSVHEVIIDRSIGVEADLLAMGTTGRTGIRRMALGSVAERTVRAAPIPIMTFQAQARMPEHLDRILVPTDGSEGARAGVDHAIHLATATGAALHAMHAVDIGTVANVDTGSIYEALQELGQEAIDDVRSRAIDQQVRSVEASLVTGDPDRSIVNYVEQRDIDTVVMGSHGRTGLRRLWLGSIAERVIRQSPVPVVTVKPREVLDRLSRPQPAISELSLANDRR